jgi:hypothetical protein
MNRYSTHITFATGSMTQIDIEARSVEEAREKVFAKFAPGTVASVSAWAVDRSPVTVNVSSNFIPIFDSAFGALV